MSFLMLKYIHIFCAICSYGLFFCRGVWKISHSPRLQHRWVKVLPHTVDTLLLATAIMMAVLIQQYPFVDAWLTAKTAALLLYIALGFVALKFTRNSLSCLFAWLAAQLVFFYIVLVANTHNPIPFAN